LNIPQFFDRGFTAGIGLSFDRGDAAVPPGFEHRIQKRAAILETTIETAFRHSQPFGQHFDPNAVDPASCQFHEAHRHPVLGSVFFLHLSP
jgi:hypothetical protein